MRYRFLIFATALVAAQFAVAQTGMSGSCDATFCKMTFTFGPIGMPHASAASAAYSGQQTMEYVQTLANGTHITSKSSLFSAMTYRDSQGRVRTERPMFPSHPGSKSAVNVILVEIQDPLAGYLYVLDSVNRVAHRVPSSPSNPSWRPCLWGTRDSDRIHVYVGVSRNAVHVRCHPYRPEDDDNNSRGFANGE